MLCLDTQLVIRDDNICVHSFRDYALLNGKGRLTCTLLGPENSQLNTCKRKHIYTDLGE